jgi:hypothetical protein
MKPPDQLPKGAIFGDKLSEYLFEGRKLAHARRSSAHRCEHCQGAAGRGFFQGGEDQQRPQRVERDDGYVPFDDQDNSTF